MSDEPKKERERREDFLTSRQLAEVLQVSESTVRRLSREGRIPVVRLTPRLARYHLQAVMRALEGDKQRPRPRRNGATPPEEDQQLSFEDLLRSGSKNLTTEDTEGHGGRTEKK